MAGTLSFSLKVATAVGCAALLTGLQLSDKLRVPDSNVGRPPPREISAEVERSARLLARPAAPGPSMAGRVVLDADPRGQFTANVEVDGRVIEMVVDTGATAISLSADEAARIGIHPRGADFRVDVVTANGTVRAAAVRLREVRIGSIIARDVVALVAPDGQPMPNLLGMTFFRQIRRFEIAGQRLVIEQ